VVVADWKEEGGALKELSVDAVNDVGVQGTAGD